MTGPTREAVLLERIRAGGPVPAHVAIIMDGNGRWAGERGLPRWMGHREGMKAVRRVVEAAVELGVAHLTLFAFSKENWDRPPREVEALMQLLCEYAKGEADELRRHSVRVKVFGDRERLSEPARLAIESLEEATGEGRRLQLHLAISYGARDEIVRATRRLVRLAREGRLDESDVDEERFAAELLTADRPDPDLLIRTSGELRVSNFLLWQIAYAEIHVSRVLWPDFGATELYNAVLDYQRRERRFGRVGV